MKLKTETRRAAGAIALVLIWTAASEFGANSYLFPSFPLVAEEFVSVLSSGRVLPDLHSTLWKWSLGWAAGGLLGVFAGLLLGAIPALYELFELPLEFLRALPITAVFPLFLLFFGIGDEAKIAMAFLSAFLILVVNASYGVRHSPQERRKMARAFGASDFQIFRYIVAPDALPQIFIGLRLSLSLSLIVTVVSEMFIGSDLGLGQRLYDAYLTSAVPFMYALIVLLGVLGFLLNKLLLMAESRFIYWAGR